jgi:AraC-like DNA-binding protein
MLDRKSEQFDWSRYYLGLGSDPDRPPITIVQAGISLWRAGAFYERHKSNVLGIEQITAGNLVFIQDGKEYLVGPGDVFIYREGTRHRYTTGPAGFVRKRWIFLDGMLTVPLMREKKIWTCDIIKPRNPAKITGLFRAAYRIMGQKERGWQERCSVVAYELLLELGHNAAAALPLPVATALAFMERNLGNPVTIETLREKTGLSTSHFYRLFTSHMGVSPVHYMTNQRMAWAQRLLIDTRLSVKEVAQTVGYDNQLYFSAQFKKHAGMSPKYFRASKRNPAAQAP